MRRDALTRVALLCLLATAPVFGGELKVLSSNAVSGLFARLGPQFERMSGARLVIQFDTSQQITRRILNGEAFDVAIVTHESAATLTAAGRSAWLTDIARSGIGIAVKAESPSPDVGTEAGFRAALLNARHIGYSSTGSSGLYVDELLARLGLPERVKSQSMRAPSEQLADMLSDGRIDLLLQQMSEIASIKSAHLAGPLPATLQHYSTFSAVIAANDAHYQEAAALLALLTEPSTLSTLVLDQLEPP